MIPIVSPEARRRFVRWMQRYDADWGSPHSPLIYTLRTQLPIELPAGIDLVVVEVDVMQDEYFGASGWQRALFLDADGNQSRASICDLESAPDGWTMHRFRNGDLLRIAAAGIVSSPVGQVMLAPVLERFDRRGTRLWASRHIAGALPNRARDEKLFDFDRTLPSTGGARIAVRGNHVVVETDRDIAVIDARTGRRVRSGADVVAVGFQVACDLA